MEIIEGAPRAVETRVVNGDVQLVILDAQTIRELVRRQLVEMTPENLRNLQLVLVHEWSKFSVRIRIFDVLKLNWTSFWWPHLK